MESGASMAENQERNPGGGWKSMQTVHIKIQEEFNDREEIITQTEYYKVVCQGHL